MLTLQPLCRFRKAPIEALKRKAAEAKAKAEAEAAAAKAKAEAEAEAARLRAMARQLAFAEAWGNGRLARVKYSIVKAEAIAEAKAEGRNWADGGGGLLKKRKNHLRGLVGLRKHRCRGLLYHLRLSQRSSLRGVVRVENLRPRGRQVGAGRGQVIHRRL